MIDGSISVDLNYERKFAWNRHEGRHGKAMQFHKMLAIASRNGNAVLGHFCDVKVGSSS